MNKFIFEKVHIVNLIDFFKTATDNIVKFKKMSQTRLLLCTFVIFTIHWQIKQKIYQKWYKHWLCAWDSNPGRRRIQWAMAAPIELTRLGSNLIFKLFIGFNLTNFQSDRIIKFNPIMEIVIRIEFKVD